MTWRIWNQLKYLECLKKEILFVDICEIDLKWTSGNTFWTIVWRMTKLILDLVKYVGLSLLRKLVRTILKQDFKGIKLALLWHLAKMWTCGWACNGLTSLTFNRMWKLIQIYEGQHYKYLLFSCDSISREGFVHPVISIYCKKLKSYKIKRWNSFLEWQ